MDRGRTLKGAVIKRGSRIADRFTILEAVGLGRAGTVFRAFDDRAANLVAVKAFLSKNPALFFRFEREVEIQRGLRHPAMVKFVLSGSVKVADDEVPFMAMEWLHGHNLEKHLLTRGPLSEEEAWGALSAVGSLLAVAHANGIVHRDIKPGNLFLVGGALDNLRVLDFGIAQLQSGAVKTAAGVALGTPAYMSPEQARGLPTVGPPSDLFSLGSVLFETLAGAPPFVAHHPIAVMTKIMVERAPRLSEIRPDIDPALTGLIDQLLEPDPLARPQDGGAFMELVRRAHPMAPVEAPRERLSLTGDERALRSVLLVQAPPTELRALFELAGGSRGVAVVARGGGVHAVTFEGAWALEIAAAATADQALKLRASGHRVAIATGRIDAEALTGTCVDVALARLASSGEAEVLIDELTSALIRDHFEVAESSRPTLIGRLGPAESERARLLEREGSLGLVRRIFASVVDEERAFKVLGWGRLGVGKSRWLSAAMEELADHPSAPAILEFPPATKDGTPRVILALRRHFDVASTDAPETVRYKLEARLSQTAGSVDALVQGLLGLLTGRDPNTETARGSFEALLGQMLADRPLIAAVDDLDALDLPSSRWLDAAFRKHTHAPMLFIGTASLTEADAALPPVETPSELSLELAPLSEEAQRAIAASSRGRENDETWKRLYESASGNLNQLVVPKSESGARAEVAFAALPPAARRVLRACAVLGQADVEAVSYLTAHTPADVRQVLSQLEGEGMLVRTPSGAYGFATEAYAKAAYGSFTPDDLQRAHQLAADWVTQTRGPEALAEWHERAAEYAGTPKTKPSAAV